MAVRQYVGARYVAKIYENSLNPSSADWESGVAYEPLTMVTYNSSSYISRKTVAASVGDPANNPDYWAVTGLYNGQIVTLQNQINAINAELASINKRVWIFVGDSYGESPTLGQDWETYTKSILTAHGVKSYICHISGGSFANSVKYLTALQGLTVDDPDEITDILVAGGYNDLNLNIYTGLASFITYAKATYPNAKIHYAPFCCTFDAASTGKTIALRNNAIQSARNLDVTIINDMWLAFRDYSALGADHIHPVDAGSKMIADAVSMYCLGGGVFIENNYGTATITLESSIINTGASTINEIEFRSKDDVVMIFDMDIELSSDLTFSSDTVIGTITAPKYVYGQWVIRIPITGTGTVSGNPEVFTGTLSINGGIVSLRINSSSAFSEVKIDNTLITIPMTIA